MNPDYRDMLLALSAEAVEFLVIGAYAVIVHGRLRSTADFDIFVRPSPENAKRVWLALRRFGAPLTDLSAEDLTSKDLVYQIGIPPNRIDIITDISGVEFDEAWNGRILAEIEGHQVPVIGRAELIRNKLASGRHKDLDDVEALQKLATAQAEDPALRPSRRKPTRKRR